MAFITDILNTIKNARKGKDMRQAIYDGIQQCYKDATGHPDSVAAVVERLKIEKGRIDELATSQTFTGNYTQSNLVFHAYRNAITGDPDPDDSYNYEGTSGKHEMPICKIFQEGTLDFAEKQSNEKVKILKEGLYIFELRIFISGSGKLDIEARINDVSQRYNAWQIVAQSTEETKIIAYILYLKGDDVVSFYGTPGLQASVRAPVSDVNCYVLDWIGKAQISDCSKEISDIRVGEDGAVYGTAGEAVRKQIGNLTEDINEQTGSYLQGKQLFNANDFSIGACTSGLKTESQFRITNAKETFEKSTPIKCKIGDALNINVDLANSDFIGCRVGIHEISNSYFVSDSGWLQVTNKGVSYTVKHKSTIGVNVSFSFSKNSNTVITNSTEYTGELTLDKLLSNIKISVVMGDSVVSNVQLGEMYNNLKKAITMPRMIYKSDPAFDIFLNAESKYRLQGCTVGKEFLYYSMTEQDNSNSYIYKVSLSNGELVSSSAGKYGHAGDMTFNPNTNEIITLTAEISYTDLFILDADTLLLKKTIRVNTEGWRLATIAYNPYTKGYVAEFAKNNTWSEYKFAFTDTNFSIISGFNSIKQGYTLQGIECDGRYVYAMYAYPNIVIVYDVNGSYVGYIKIPFTTESECIAKHNDILFIGEDGEKKIYKVQLQYEWDD
nr:MAG TPA_asm: hypothetical protein [Bacteriophage sp.]